MLVSLIQLQICSKQILRLLKTQIQRAIGDNSMTSRLVVSWNVRHTGASADAITLDASSGNVTFPANATCSDGQLQV